MRFSAVKIPLAALGRLAISPIQEMGRIAVFFSTDRNSKQYDKADEALHQRKNPGGVRPSVMLFLSFGASIEDLGGVAFPLPIPFGWGLRSLRC